MFWKKIEQVLSIIKPISIWITKLESEKPCISDVFYAFYDIYSTISTILPNITFITNIEKKTILTNFESRKKMAIHPIHYASAILDPKYQGINLESQ